MTVGYIKCDLCGVFFLNSNVRSRVQIWKHSGPNGGTVETKDYCSACTSKIFKA